MPSANITKRAIAEAMKELMAEKPLAKISVGDIAAACGINRNTFYYHFRDKFDLVNWIFYTDLAAELNRDDILSGAPWLIVEDVCAFLHQNRGFYISALSVGGQNSFARYFEGLLRAVVEARLPELLDTEGHREFYVSFFADAMVSAIFRWLRGGTEMAPGELAELMRRALLIERNGEA